MAARTAATAVVPTMAAALAAALALGSGSLAGRPPYELDRIPPMQLGSPVANPLDEIAERLTRPDAEVFQVRTAASVDRWQLVVLDRFDGAAWTPDAHYLRLGAELPPVAATAAPLRRGEAAITLDEDSPWLPSQRGTTTVTGIDPLVDAATGTLRGAGPGGGSVVPARLGRAGGDRGRAPGSAGGPGRRWAARPARAGSPRCRPASATSPRPRSATGRPRSAPRWCWRSTCGRTTCWPPAPTVPTGSGWVQLQRFLLQGGSGTSEQFATAYVVLARVLGIPARVVVGFRQPDRPEPDGAYVVRNRDILAWPEVAVQGAGWVPVDPMPERADPGAARPAPLPPAPRPRPPAAAPPPADPADPAAADPGATGTADPPAAVLVWAPVAGSVLLLGLLGWLAGVPVAKAVRRARRRRRAGPAAVAAAWLEARDQLRSHRVVASAAMTVRDLARAAVAAAPPGGGSPGRAGSPPAAPGPAGPAEPAGAPGGPTGPLAHAGGPSNGAVGGAVGGPAGRSGGPAGRSGGPAGRGGGGPAGGAGQDGLRRLAEVVDIAAWSGGTVDQALVDEAWDAVGAVRRDLAGGPLPARVRAAVDVRSLLPPR